MPWHNTHFGIGSSSHAIGSTTYVKRAALDREVIEALFRQCGVARKIVTRMPFDATREGWDRYPGIDEELSRALAKEERRLRLSSNMTQALIYEREFGGAAVILEVDDGLQAWEPLVKGRIRAIRKMVTRHRWELWPNTYRGNNYADPETYQITPDDGSPTQIVHVSRMLLFPGETSSDQVRIENWGWGDPVLESVWEEIRNVGISDAGVIEYLLQLSVPFLKVSKWWQLIAGKGGKAAAQTMLEEFRQRLSTFRLAVLDAGDSVERLNATVSGISEILEHQKAQVSAVTDYPQTLLYGRSPEGMNATGLSDLELYYGIVRAKVQEDRLREPLEQATEMIARAPVWGDTLSGETFTNPLPQEVRDQDPGIEFRPLWVPRELEQAQVAQTKAATRTAYASAGWIDMDEGRKLLEKDGMLEPPSVDEFDPEEEEAPEEEANPLEPPQEVVDAVSLGVLRARRAGQQVPTWEESVARTLAGGRAITRAQATQLRLMLQDEAEALRGYFGGDVTLAWLRGLSGADSAPVLPAAQDQSLSRTDAEELVPWRGRQIRIEVRAGQPRSFPGTPYPDVIMPCDYGEVVGTVGLDGDPVDVLMVRGGADTCYAGIILHPENGQMDEVKLVVGARSTQEADALLLCCYGGSYPGGAVEVMPEDLGAFLPSAGEREDAELSAEDRTPSVAASEAAQRALEVRAKKPPSQRGMTPVGLARARDIANRRPLSVETWRRVKAYGDRHEVDKQGETWDEQGPGWQAWNGWGGDPGYSQARRLVRSAEAGG